MRFESDAVGLVVSPSAVGEEIAIIIIDTMIMAILVLEVSIESVQSCQLKLQFIGVIRLESGLTIRSPISWQLLLLVH